LRRMRKPYTAKSAELLVRRAKNAGLKTEIFIMIGFPGETEPEFNKTLEFIKRNKSYIDSVGNVGVCFIMSGSMIYKYPKMFNFTLTNNPERWYDQYNNHKIRTKKAMQVIKLLDQLKIPLSVKNLYKE